MSIIIDEISAHKKDIEQALEKYGYKIIPGTKNSSIEMIDNSEDKLKLIEALKKSSDLCVRTMRDMMFKKTKGIRSFKKSKNWFSLYIAARAYNAFEDAENAYNRNDTEGCILARDKGLKLKSGILKESAKVDRGLKAGQSKIGKTKYIHENHFPLIIEKYKKYMPEVKQKNVYQIVCEEISNEHDLSISTLQHRAKEGAIKKEISRLKRLEKKPKKTVKKTAKKKK